MPVAIWLAWRVHQKRTEVSVVGVPFRPSRAWFISWRTDSPFVKWVRIRPKYNSKVPDDRWHPEFRYRVGDLKVSEYLAKLPGKSGLIRRFKIDGSANGIVWEIDPDSGVSYSFDKGKFSDSAWRLTKEESRSFQVHMQELPGKFPFCASG